MHTGPISHTDFNVMLRSNQPSSSLGICVFLRVTMCSDVTRAAEEEKVRMRKCLALD